ncbi:hypothetical protein SEA_LILBEANIE_91 [Gordonia phage Lilbeanie]|uniref:Uncharacterized protein n=1 Tax=Gordonia phage Lilbeanie TaxID=2794947 RepID=A0A7T1KSD1_9CAUD|nr:hypothetical protein J1773_gp91 [Gordonia phage Lilbeanie]QPO17169.1 hypothetical protein SEA_LILBEANIE_91 [Gordonia phage Lilbeanie]
MNRTATRTRRTATLTIEDEFTGEVLHRAEVRSLTAAKAEMMREIEGWTLPTIARRDDEGSTVLMTGLTHYDLIRIVEGEDVETVGHAYIDVA